MLRLDRFARRILALVAVVGDEPFGREDVRRGEHRSRPQRADTGAIEHGFLALDLLPVEFALALAALLAMRDRIGMVEAIHGLLQAATLVVRHGIENRF